MKTTFNITGMSCAACSARVEKAVSALTEIDKCSVNLLTNSMVCEGSADADEIIEAVKKAGYGAYVADGKKETKKESTNDADIIGLRNRLISSAIFLILLMYISMGYMMWGWPLPAVLAKDHVAMGLCQLLLTTVIMVINQKFFINGFKGLVKGSPNMDTLVALGSSAAYIYSVFALFAMSGARESGNAHNMMKYMHDFYFESAAMILTLITLGKMLEAYSKGKTTNALKALMDLTPRKANVIRDGKEFTIDVSELVAGDIFAVKPGESIPADGIVIEGHSSADESALTGESIPVDKSEGSKVSAASINKYGYLKCRATHVGEDTSLAKIIKMVTEASSGKAPIAKIADKVSGVFVPIVMIIALFTIGIWLILGESAGFALARGISVLVISCPCALGLATPVAIMVGSGLGAKNGILFKTAQSLEQTGKIKVCVFDKTGTVTAGTPQVTDVIPSLGVQENELLTTAFGLEKMSEHPLSEAIVKYAKEKDVPPAKITGFEIVPGKGLVGAENGHTVMAGSLTYIKESVNLPPKAIETAEKLATEGKTAMLFVKNGKFLGVIAVADTLRPDSRMAINTIKKMGIRTVLLTGDNERTAQAIGKECGIDEVIAQVLPDEKERVISEIQKYEPAAMVGDGINDAPALTTASVGIAIGAGTDIAIDAADVVVTGSTITDVASAITLSRKTIRNIKQNLFWAFCYNVIGIPLAAGVWISLLGWEMNPMFGAAAMSLSSFCVVCNALRLNFAKIKAGSSKENHNTNKEKEISIMKKTFKIEGMMCPHCEARVKQVLEALDGVESVVASHEKCTAVLTLGKDVADDVIVKTIEDQGYKVIG